MHKVTRDFLKVTLHVLEISVFYLRDLLQGPILLPLWSPPSFSRRHTASPRRMSVLRISYNKNKTVSPEFLPCHEPGQPVLKMTHLGYPSREVSIMFQFQKDPFDLPLKFSSKPRFSSPGQHPKRFSTNWRSTKCENFPKAKGVEGVVSVVIATHPSRRTLTLNPLFPGLHPFFYYFIF